MAEGVVSMIVIEIARTVCDALTAVAEVLAAKVPGERACALAEQCRQDAKRFKSTRSLPSDEIHNPPPPGHHFIVPPGAPAPQSSGYLLQDSPPGGLLPRGNVV